jgi:hypothetical protein
LPWGGGFFMGGGAIQATALTLPHNLMACNNIVHAQWQAHVHTTRDKQQISSKEEGKRNTSRSIELSSIRQNDKNKGKFLYTKNMYRTKGSGPLWTEFLILFELGSRHGTIACNFYKSFRKKRLSVACLIHLVLSTPPPNFCRTGQSPAGILRTWAEFGRISVKLEYIMDFSQM